MSNFRVHKGGLIQLGLDSGSLATYSDDFRLFECVRTRGVVLKAPSFGSPAVESKAAATSHVVNCEFATNEGSSSGIWQLMWTAQATTTGELYFSVVVGRGSVSATNPKFTGYLLVTDLGFGSAPNQVRSQTRSFPARAVSNPLSS
jgi:hypothetical protein